MTEIERLASELEKLIPTPERGLPEPVFRLVSRLTPMVNVDLLVRGADGRILLTWRQDEFFPDGGWHIPGGIVRSRESRETRIAVTARKELGIRVKADPEALCSKEFIMPGRRTRGHFISFLYRCRALDALPEERMYSGRGAPRSGEAAWFDGCPDTLLDVQKVYCQYFVQ